MEKDNIRQQDPFSAYEKKKIVLRDGRVYTGNILRLAHGKVELVVSLDKEDILEIRPMNQEESGEDKPSLESGKDRLARAIADMFGEEWEKETGENKAQEEEILWYLHPVKKQEQASARPSGRKCAGSGRPAFRARRFSFPAALSTSMTPKRGSTWSGS